MNRLFIALEIPRQSLRLLIAQRDSLCPEPHFRWEPPEKLHVTLRFLGDTSAADTSNVAAALRALRHERCFPLSFSLFGFFYRARIPVILWAGFQESPELLKLFHTVNGILKPFPFPADTKPFSPHLTILRVRENSDFARLKPFERRPIDAPPFTADTVSLISSTLLPSGSVYKTLEKYSFSTD